MPSTSLSSAASADLATCREILSRGSKSFALASRLLPARLRDSAAALYAFCRVADDAVDEDAANADSALADLRRRLAGIERDRPDEHPVDRALARVVAATSLPVAPLEALLEGFEWDVKGRHYHSMEDVFAYGARVAGTIGVLMTVLMGRREPHVLARACDLGVAMQLTNIARDVGEDARNGRLYLPRTELLALGVELGVALGLREGSGEQGVHEREGEAEERRLARPGRAARGLLALVGGRDGHQGISIQ